MAVFAACPASYYFIKMSILLFYLRIFPPTKKITYTAYFLMAYCTIYYAIAFITTVTICNVKNKEWGITMTMNCFAYGDLMLALGWLDLLVDVLILAFPLPMVVKLKVSRPQKVYLVAIFSCGIM